MHGPSDVEWYERVSGVGLVVEMDTIVPELDNETVRVLDVAHHHGFAIID